MGLDMYAARRLYVKQWDHQSADERYTVQIAQGGKPVPGIQSDRISNIEEELMYWRKANHIHAWFVDNVQDGMDDCKDHYLSEDNLRELLSVCEKVVKASNLVDGLVYDGTVYDKEHPDGLVRRIPGKVIEDSTVARNLLPTRSGFFFGSEEYDEDYLDEVARTHEWAVRTLAEIADGTPGHIFYSSSW